MKGRCACEFGYDFDNDRCVKGTVMTLERDEKTVLAMLFAYFVLPIVFVVVGLLLVCCMVFLIVRCICNAAN